VSLISWAVSNGHTSGSQPIQNVRCGFCPKLKLNVSLMRESEALVTQCWQPQDNDPHAERINCRFAFSPPYAPDTAIGKPDDTGENQHDHDVENELGVVGRD
jgi:hypothetical protein